MGVLIIGSGIAGLSVAIRIKQIDTHIPVEIVERHGPSTSQISGMRLRTHSPESHYQAADATTKARLHDFDALTQESARFLSQFCSSEEHSSWFGPQYSKGEGGIAVHALREGAISAGVSFVKGEVVPTKELSRGTILVKNAQGEYYDYHPDITILANGGIGGTLFESSSLPYQHSGIELGWNAGLSIQGITNGEFIHPFGRCRTNGTLSAGVYGTDDLEKAVVLLGNGQVDEETMELLKKHRAHYHFDEIAKRFLETGGQTVLRFPDGMQKIAHVVHHFSHIGLYTDDGITVATDPRIFAAGDSGSMAYWTGDSPRLPGMALAKALNDGILIQQKITAEAFLGNELYAPLTAIQSKDLGTHDCPVDMNALRHINTQGLFAARFGDAISAYHHWENQLVQLGDKSSLGELSLGVVHTLQKKAIDPSIHEPVRLTREHSSHQEGNHHYQFLK